MSDEQDKSIESIKRSRGRPFVYSPDLCDKLFDLMCLGYTDCQIYTEFGVSEATFYRWKNEHPEFKEAYDRGYPEAEKVWMQKGMDFMVDGNKGAYMYWITFMNRKFKWSRNTNNDTQTQININNVNINKSPTELIDYIVGECIETNILENSTLDGSSQQLLESRSESTSSSEQEVTSGVTEDSGGFEDPLGQEKI